MGNISVLFLVLAVLSSAATLVGLLWMLFAYNLWGHPAGPPSHLSPEEARRWTHAHPGGRGTDHRMSWAQMRRVLQQGNWREVWPLALLIGGIGATMAFLGLAVLLGSDKPWNGIIGLLMAAIYVMAVYRVMGAETSG